jgi:hypothetical protein
LIVVQGEFTLRRHCGMVVTHETQYREFGAA